MKNTLLLIEKCRHKINPYRFNKHESHTSHGSIPCLPWISQHIFFFADCCTNIGTLEIHTAGKGTQQAAIAVNRLHPEEPPSNFYPIEPPSGFQPVEPPSLPAPVEWTIDNAAASNDLGSPGLEFPPSAPFLDHESFLDYPDWLEYTRIGKKYLFFLLVIKCKQNKLP